MRSVLTVLLGVVLVAGAFTVDAATISATYSWTDTSTNETGFKIQRKTGTGAYVQIGQVEANIQSYVDTQGLVLNEDYCYRSITFNANGEAAPGAEVCGSTCVSSPPTSGVLMITIAP
jgi:hypothetical protein